MDKYYITGKTAVQIADSLEAAILDGELSQGMRLPSVREAADHLGVNRNTVAQAYARLRERGLVHGKGRGGTRVALAATTGQAAAPETPPPGTVDLASGNVDATLLPSLAAAVTAQNWTQSGYDHPGDDPVLMAVLRERFTAEGIPARSLMLCHSALDAVERALRGHTRSGAEVIVEDPAWPPLISLLRSLGLRPVPTPVYPDGVDPAALAGHLNRHTAAVVLTPRAQNPTGANLDNAHLARIQELLSERRDILLVLDDHWGVLSSAPPPAIADSDAPWLLVRSLSKPLGPDLRVAAVTGDARTVTRMHRQFRLGPRWVSRVIQQLVLALLRDGATEDCVARARQAYRERRQRLVEALRARGISVADGSGINLWIPVADEGSVVQGMAARGYSIQAGQPFRLKSPDAVRVSIGNIHIDAVDAVAGALAQCVARGVSPAV
ncbi:aminotransferase class I/II-fold pyridoxal phosphate-dependent enzyme [Arhodomonas sp. AD133]|uniref:aminotransferase class I/II-fold pyridoxal phosphate-dependent enzyme n=1 Tax=Arhodomonas sp. AD133 TaxID=3415009 RepID=UPI003EB783C4